jgi:hypothetical protein
MDAGDSRCTSSGIPFVFFLADQVVALGDVRGPAGGIRVTSADCEGLDTVLVGPRMIG